MSSTMNIDDLCAMDLSLICRGCLATSGEMKNMVEWGLTDEFYRLTNIQVNTLDNPSLLLCLKCEDVLYKIRSFKAMCQTADQMLKSAAEKKQSKESDWASTQTNINPQDNIIHTEITNNGITLKITAPNMDQKIHLPCHHCPHHSLKKTDLISHLAKHHKMADTFIIKLQYYCHILYCPYNINSGKDKHFNGRKYLNQHIFKVHKQKINCIDCKLSFSNEVGYKRHLKTCNLTHVCNVCGVNFNTNEKLLVHLLRKHPEYHKKYKNDNKKRQSESKIDSKIKEAKTQVDYDKIFFCDSPKRSFATQTLEHVKNDVTLASCQAKKDEISTQTVFEDLLSLKSNMSEDETIFSDSVSLSDIQTQTAPLEFGLSRSHKETITSETQSPDLSIKETQTCICLYDSPKPNFRCTDSVSSSPSTFSMLTSTETQTLDDFLRSSAETQTCFDDDSKEL